MNKMIQIENISKVFRTTEVETVALNHVNLEVRFGCYNRFVSLSFRFMPLHLPLHYRQTDVRYDVRNSHRAVSALP